MNYRIDFLPQVEEDIQDAFDWYELQLQGLGEDFIDTHNGLEKDFHYHRARSIGHVL